MINTVISNLNQFVMLGLERRDSCCFFSLPPSARANKGLKLKRGSFSTTFCCVILHTTQVPQFPSARHCGHELLQLLRYLEESTSLHVTCQNLVQNKADSFVLLLQVTGGVWTFSRICCDIFVTMDVMMCTASILNLCAISIDR